MEEIAIFATAVITILGVAYPIILQLMGKLEETYSSSLVLEIFETEPSKKWFIAQLYISLVLLLLWALKLQPIDLIAGKYFFIDQSAPILVIVSTTLLVISFIRLANKVILYSVRNRVVRYFIKKHHERH